MFINSRKHPLEASPCPSVNSGLEWDCRPGAQHLSADFLPEVSEFLETCDVGDNENKAPCVERALDKL